MPGNPGTAATDENARRIVAHGFRNPFRMAFRPGSSELWVGDVGRSRWEEIDRIIDPLAAPVFNGGFPCIEGPEVATDWARTNLCARLVSQTGATAAPYFSYGHEAGVTADDACYVPAAAITGLTFYPLDGPFPASLHGALLWADISRSCIYAMPLGPDGLPSPADAQVFASSVSAPVDLQISPAGELVYVDVSGAVRVIGFHGSGQPSDPQINASRLSGDVPLDVHLEASIATSGVDSGGSTIAWDLDDDGRFDDGSSARVEWRTETPGRHAVRVRITDAVGAVRSAGLALTAGEVEPTMVDDFDSGDLAGWFEVHMADTIDVPGRGQVLALAAEGDGAFVRTLLPASVQEAYLRASIRATLQGDHAVYLARFLDGSGSAIAGLYLTPDGRLAIRADRDDQSASSARSLLSGEWHEFVFRARTGTATDALEVWLDGRPVEDLPSALGLGAPLIAAVQLGDSVEGRRFELLVDDFAVGPSLRPEVPAEEGPPVLLLGVGVAVLILGALGLLVVARNRGSVAAPEP
jgi:hypothetical protein